MNFLPLQKKLGGALLFLFCGAAVLRAEPQEQRWLLVFDTSSAMKKRLPAVEAEVKTLLLTGLGGKIAAGDSVGVWTCGDTLHMGQFPLTLWTPDETPLLASNLTVFVASRKYSGTANLAALQPTLGGVIASSERLTVLVFSDGTKQINWTPYDDGINEMLRQTAAERKKSQQPAVIVLRTQEGKYVGATVNFPPAAVTFPPFPPLPREMKPTNPPPAVASAPPKPVAPAVPPLIIVGTHVTTDTNDIAKPVAVVSNLVLAPVIKTSAAAPPPVLKPNAAASVPTNVASVSAPTNSVTMAPADSGDDRLTKILTGCGIALLVLAVALVVFLLRRRGAPRGSLITSSMQGNFRPPEQK